MKIFDTAFTRCHIEFIELFAIIIGAFLLLTTAPTYAQTCNSGTTQIADIVVAPDSTFECVVSEPIILGPTLKVEERAHVIIGGSQISILPKTTISRGAYFRAIALEGNLSELNRVSLGSLVGAEINAYRVDGSLSIIEGPLFTDNYPIRPEYAGTFKLSLAEVPDDELVLVAVSGGHNYDTVNNGPDFNSPHLGTLYSIATARDWRDGVVRVSSISTIAWELTSSMVGSVSPRELKLRLDDLAKVFLQNDIDGDGIVSLRDIYFFNEKNDLHRNYLNFSYEILNQNNAASSMAIIELLFSGDHDNLLSEIELIFGSFVELYPAKDDRYSDINFSVIVTGEGEVSDVGGIISIDTDNSQKSLTSYWIDQSLNEEIVLTATPKPGSSILEWVGCDHVSQDGKHCSIRLIDDHLVRVAFGFQDFSMSAPVHNISTASVSLTEDSVELLVSADDSTLLDELELL